MQAIIDLLNNYLSDESTLKWTVVVLVGGVIFILALGISVIVMGVTNPVRRRLGMVNQKEEAPKGALALRISTAMGPLAAFVLPKEELERNKIKHDLYKAGFRTPQAMQIFYAMKAVLAVSLASIVLLASPFLPNIDTQTLMMYAAMAGAVGLLLPNYVLSKALERQMRLLRNAFPDALDLLVVCVESGLGLGPALQRVADEISVSHPELALDLSTVNAEMRAGVQREKALRNLADRTGLPDIRGLVALLVQSMRFGTSVADALRIYSEEFRDKRMQAAEEQAAKIGTKMIFPLVLFMFPVFFVVAVGPAALRIIDAFKSL
ncbi:MAG: type II secretion system F family protein [Gammaproteobacteria bacterium]|nr:type II secretion system F family protein [Gammaproteobacteria bacterium]MBU2675614.1 type II secretion system F family protein [Gammaproteobacteria bacterium]NNC56587.1 type II secretion system F family protein [Woeseiaceae bacterium]NNL49349.1 type II secretion system F family protein [Woeseiaceae bacterium]